MKHVKELFVHSPMKAGMEYLLPEICWSLLIKLPSKKLMSTQNLFLLHSMEKKPVPNNDKCLLLKTIFNAYYSNFICQSLKIFHYEFHYCIPISYQMFYGYIIW